MEESLALPEDSIKKLESNSTYWKWEYDKRGERTPCSL